jgi:hypothetical protein
MAGPPRAVLKEIQDALGIPWVPEGWRILAQAPEVAGLLWSRVEPVVSSGLFLRESLALMGHAFGDLASTYGTGEGLALPPADRRGILQELDALLYGETQLLLQHVLLHLALRDGAVGRPGPAEGTRPRSAYRRRVLEEVEVDHAPLDVQRLWADMQDALNLTIGVPIDARVLAKWIGFMEPAWKRFKAWRGGGGGSRGFFEACGALARRAEAAARAMRPPVGIDQRELLAAAGQDPGVADRVARLVERLAMELPGIVLVDAFFRVEAAVHPEEYRERVVEEEPPPPLSGGWA